MLKLSRSIGQSIYIGDDVIVTVLHRQGNQILIGVSAPKHIPVHREERYHRLKVKELTTADSTNNVDTIASCHHDKAT